MKKLKFIIIIALILALNTTTFSDVVKLNYASEISKVSKNMVVDYKNYMQKNDLVYRQPATDGKNGIPLGNGTMGAILWNEHGVDFQVGRSDVFQYNNKFGGVDSPSLGKFTLKTSDLESFVDYDQRLSLYDGVLSSSVKLNNSGTEYANYTAYVDAGADVMVIDYFSKSSINESIILEYNLWEDRNPQIMLDKDGFTVQEKFSEIGGADSGIAMVVKVVGADVSVSNPTAQKVNITFNSKTERKFKLFISSASNSNVDAGLQKAKVQIDNVIGDMQGSIANHKIWWNEYWKSSFISLNSTSGDAEYYESLWYFHLYQMAASSRGKYPSKFNSVMWQRLNDNNEWGSGFWNYNTRDLYFPMFTANKLDMLAPYYNLYTSAIDKIREETPKKFQADGIYHKLYPDAPKKENIKGLKIPEIMNYDGRAQGENYYVFLAFNSGIDVSYLYYQYYQYTHDLEFLKNEAYPIIKGVCEFLMSFAGEKDENGLYNFFPINAEETLWYAKNPADIMGGVRMVLDILIDTSKKLDIDSNMVAIWEEFKNNLAPIPLTEDGTQILQAIRVPETKHMNSQDSQLELIYPIGMYGIDLPNYELAKKSFVNRENYLSCGWALDSVWAARLGMGDEAEKILSGGTNRFQTFASGLTHFGGDANSHTFYTEWNGLLATTINEMLLQSYDGSIKVFPAIPQSKGWNDLKFSLLAEGGFMVTAESKNYVTKYVDIESKNGGVVKLKNPWNEPVVVENSKGNKQTLSGDFVEFLTSKGETYNIVPQNKNGDNALAETISSQRREARKTFRDVQYGFGEKGEGGVSIAPTTPSVTPTNWSNFNDDVRTSIIDNNGQISLSGYGGYVAGRIDKKINVNFTKIDFRVNVENLNVANEFGIVLTDKRAEWVSGANSIAVSFKCTRLNMADIELSVYQYDDINKKTILIGKKTTSNCVFYTDTSKNSLEFARNKDGNIEVICNNRLVDSSILATLESKNMLRKTDDTFYLKFSSRVSIRTTVDWSQTKFTLLSANYR